MTNDLLPQKQKILVIDDHETVLNGTIYAIKQHYPEAEIRTAQTAQQALEQLPSLKPDLVVMDLSIPEKLGEHDKSEVGIQLLKTIMQQYPTLNITVQSGHMKTLVRIKPTIDTHQGGFTVADKGLSTKDMLVRIDWAMQGITYTKDLKAMQRGIEIKQDWLKLLQLAFEEELQDKEIAKRMLVSDRTVRHYWTKVQDVLEVYPDEGKKNIRIQTEKRAREAGLID